MYKWSKAELSLKYFIKKLSRNEEYSIYQEMISLSNLKKNAIDFENFNLQCKSNNFNDLSAFFTEDYELIPDDIYSTLIELYKLFPDNSAFYDNIRLSKLNLSEKEKIGLAYNIIESMNNPDLLKYFKDIINHHKHILNIQECEAHSSHINALGGFTLNLPNKGYINLYWNNTINDIINLIHETLHYILPRISGVREIVKGPFTELEGCLGTKYAQEFLLGTKYKTDAELSLRSTMNDNIINCFLLLVNHLLFETREKSQFKLIKFREELKSEIPEKYEELTDKEIMKYTGICAFETIIELIGYISALDIFKNSSDFNQALSYTSKLAKITDFSDILTIKYPITFLNDNFKNLTEEYNKTRSIKL